MTSINKSQAEIQELLAYIGANSEDSGVTLNKDEFEQLFEEMEYYNNSDWENGENKNIEYIGNKIAELEDKISKLQAEAEGIQDDIDAINTETQKKYEEVAKITIKILKAETDYQTAVEEASNNAARDAFDAVRNNENATDEDYKKAYAEAFDGYCPAQYKGLIQNLMIEQSHESSLLEADLEQVYSCQRKLSNLKTKLDVTTGTIKMLERTKSNMASQMEGAYKNVDTDNKTPIFSGTKADFANSLLEKYQSRYSNEDSSEATANKSEEQTALMKSYSDQNTNKFVSGDRYNRATNPELENFNTLVQGGMLTKLQEAGLSKNDILTFISENWNIGVRKNEDGTWVIPYGHGTTGHRETTKGYEQDADGTAAIYKSLDDFITGTQNETAASANQAQVKELMEAMNPSSGDDILTQMYKAGFTFKEAMYTLTKIFPDAGINYDISKQATGDNPNPNAPSNDTRNYEIVEDSSTTNGTYKKIADEILEYWNVGGSHPTIEDDDGTETEHGDPMSFNKDGKTYTFIEDRNNDGKFDYTDGFNNDLLGSKNGMSELLAYDYNGDGKIDANDKVTDENGNAVQMTVLNADGTTSTRDKTALDMLQVMINNQTESVAKASDVDDYKDGDSANNKSDNWTNQVDFGIGYTSAANLGITEIDLSKFAASTNEDGTVNYQTDLTGDGDERYNTNKGYDNTEEAFEDINGSAVINQFNIKMGGEDITVNETLNSLDNLETFYGQIAKEAGQNTNSNNIVIGFDQATVQDALDSTKWEGYTSGGDVIGEGGKTLEEISKALNEQIDDMADQLKEKEEIIKSHSNLKDLINTDVKTIFKEIEQQCDDPETPDINPTNTNETEETDETEETEEPEETPAPQTPPANTDVSTEDELIINPNKDRF